VKTGISAIPDLGLGSGHGHGGGADGGEEARAVLGSGPYIFTVVKTNLERIFFTDGSLKYLYHTVVKDES